jgi:hypothetical protein
MVNTRMKTGYVNIVTSGIGHATLMGYPALMNLQQVQLEILILSWIFHEPLINPVLDSSSHYFGINPLLLPL